MGNAPSSQRASQLAGQRASQPSSRGGGGEDRLAKALGWFSIGLGVPQLVAPGRVSRLVGIEDTPRTRAVMRAVGARELAGAAGILSRPRPAGFLFARVAGDALDLLLLRAAVDGRGDRKGGNGRSRRRVVSAAVAVAGVTVLDVVASARTSRSAEPTTSGTAIRAHAAITVNRPRRSVYTFWRDLENLPRFMAHLESVHVSPDGRSHWVALAPAGATVEWDAEVAKDVPYEEIAWRSIGGDVPNSGSVRFADAPAGRGTEVVVDLEYEPPGKAVGAAVARLLGRDAPQQIRDDLRRVKQVLETGEVVRSEGTPGGTHTRAQVHQHEAQPVP